MMHSLLMRMQLSHMPARVNDQASSFVVSICSAKVMETPEMLALMQEEPLLAQKLVLASISSGQKRKADQAL